MTSREFARAFYDEKEGLLDLYFERKPYPYAYAAPKSDVAEFIKALNLDNEKQEVLFKIVDGALRDALYTVLLGLDGCSSIGNALQQMYEVYDEEGNQLTGDLDGYAYEFFHGISSAK